MYLEISTKLNELNLINIKHLSETFMSIGFSDHTTSTDMPVYAISLGAKIIEKHITINNKSKGPVINLLWKLINLN